MSKKITEITIHNCRGYFGKYKPLVLPNGENVLIYGENGSGKSSLYKALNDFFKSSRDSSIKFIRNRYLLNKNGKVEIQFSDCDPSTKTILNGTEQLYSFSNKNSTHNILFIQNTDLIKGFLDYTDLLKVYLHSDPEPNLFELILLNLLGEHIPHKTGGNFKFRERWEQLQEDLTDNAYTRNDRCHKNALSFLPVFETHLRATLDDVFNILNKYLSDYFNDLNIELRYNLESLNFNYGDYKWEWHTTTEFKLQVVKDGIVITDGYNEFLNEARLSAIAICLYLASLRSNPTVIDLKILFLDDVFIGLDAGNRIPILNILKNEFPDFQKFISTYDRHWFELAKRHFEIYNEPWKCIEMYVGEDVDPTSMNKISKPIVIEGVSYYEKAIHYLHHRYQPDYPASANYFRKALEDLISEHLPKYLRIDSENILIPGYKIGILLKIMYDILKKLNSDLSNINSITSLLNILLHPLSHHEITSPIYKQEIEIISKSYITLQNQLLTLNLKDNFKCLLEKKSLLRITFTISTNHSQYYQIILKYPLILDINTKALIASECYLQQYGGTNNGKKMGPFNPPKKNTNFHYLSLEDAFNKIFNHITSIEKTPFTKPSNYLDVLEYFDNSNWEPLSKKITIL